MLKRNYYLNINTGFGELNLHISFDAQNGGSLDRTLGDLARREMWREKKKLKDADIGESLSETAHRIMDLAVCEQVD